MHAAAAEVGDLPGSVEPVDGLAVDTKGTGGQVGLDAAQGLSGQDVQFDAGQRPDAGVEDAVRCGGAGNPVALAPASSNPSPTPRARRRPPDLRTTSTPAHPGWRHSPDSPGRPSCRGWSAHGWPPGQLGPRRQQRRLRPPVILLQSLSIEHLLDTLMHQIR